MNTLKTTASKYIMAEEVNRDQCLVCHETVGLKVYPVQRCDCIQTWCEPCLRRYLRSDDNPNVYVEKKCLSCDEKYGINPPVVYASIEEMMLLDLKYRARASCNGCHWRGMRVSFLLYHMKTCLGRMEYCRLHKGRFKFNEHWKRCEHCPDYFCPNYDDFGRYIEYSEYRREQCHKCYSSCQYCQMHGLAHPIIECHKCQNPIKLCKGKTMESHYATCPYPDIPNPHRRGRDEAITELERMHLRPRIANN
jgi:hypothetical protein